MKLPAKRDRRNDDNQILDNEISVIRPHFDAELYLKSNSDVRDSGIDAVTHYCAFGWKEHRDPTSGFSTLYYLNSNPDVRESGENPFFHYLTIGRDNGRNGKPESNFYTVSGEIEEKLSAEKMAVSEHFDTQLYITEYEDISESGVDPLDHYMRSGWKEGRDPSATFSTTFYLDSNPDVADLGINPFWHYIVAGKAEGRLAIGSQEYLDRGKDQTVKTDIEAIRPFFDDAFYRFKYADISKTGLDPLEHYWISGWKEGRDPSATFSTTFYLDSNPDVADLGINPFWHYIVAGKSEGRDPQHPGGYQVERLRNTEDLEFEVKCWRNNRLPENLLNQSQVTKLLRAQCQEKKKSLLISVGHDNYLKISGGVQLCEHQEEVISSSNQTVYLNISPWQPLPRLLKLDEDRDPILVLILNGEDVGCCRISNLVRSVSLVASEFVAASVVVHHLLGHAPERIAELVKSTGRNDCWFWLHDYFSLCPSFTLQRNAVSFCSAPPMQSNACTLCRFGKERISHSDRMRTFFRDLDVHVLSPSEVTAQTWQEWSDLKPESLNVQPHMHLEWRKRTTPPPRTNDKITVGFLGTPASHKGWNVFEDLFRTFGVQDGYRFVFLGASEQPVSGIDHTRVHVTAGDPDAMIDAVRKEGIDLVLHWASWPETFSLSTHEAYAGGAYVITNPISGNVAATVERLKRGAVLNDDKDLYAFFADGLATKMVEKLRKERQKYEVSHQLSRMVHDAIDRSAEEAN
jgi:hypothetical protein